MTIDEIVKALVETSELFSAKFIENVVPDQPGLYTIFVDNKKSLPSPYFEYLDKRKSNLIYLGKASKSLLKRLVKQDLKHESPSTFFRAIGPILGYRPPFGSLIGKKNRRNYIFNHSDTEEIIEWIRLHLYVRFLIAPKNNNDILKMEGVAITSLTPLLNTVYNPLALIELSRLRLLCREIAQGIKEK